MKILLINNFFSSVGGAELAAHQTYTLLQERGHEVVFFATDKQPYLIPDYPYAGYFPRHTDYDETRDFKEKLKSLPGIFYNHEARDRLTGLLKRFKPDLVHCHNLHYHLTPSVLDACQERGIPTVMTLHDTRMMCPAGTLMLSGESYCRDQHCVGGSALHCVRHRCYDKSLLQSAVVTSEFMFKRYHKLYQSVAHFITPSAALRQLAIKSGISPEQVSVIPNCLSESFLQVEPLHTPGDYFLYVGRLSKEKGIHVLLETMTHLPDSTSLHIVGTGPQESELIATAKRENLRNVRFLGFMNREEIIEQYRHAIATIIPSIWFEAFGLTAIETFACGRPVIASRLGGLQEIVDHRVNGLSIVSDFGASERSASKASRALSDAMQELLDNPALALDMGHAARQKAETVYAPQHHGRQLETLYEYVLNSVSPGVWESKQASPLPV